MQMTPIPAAWQNSLQVVRPMTMRQMLLMDLSASKEQAGSACNGDEPVLNENTSEPDVSDVENLFSTTEQADTATSEDGEHTVNEKRLMTVLLSQIFLMSP